jgi:eukaryotic-like serine/threonine-protein kinase
MLGETCGSYRLIGKVGEGGMGAVYLAEHPLIGRKAAVKVLLPEYSNRPDAVRRFLNEARATANLTHPGIVGIYDFGVHPNGSAFLVMELLEGETITARVKRYGRLPPAVAVGYVRQIATAMAVAHAVGIVHRDLKPDNLFLVRDPTNSDAEMVKVLDFGIAKLTTTDEPDGSATRTGVMMGTPYYMAPEQCRGAGRVDRRADIYSLGCITFTLLCGRPPFVFEYSGELIGAHLFQPPPSPRSLEPAIPAALEAVVLKALAKDPNHRQQTMRELSDELAAIPLDQPTPGAARVVTTLGITAPLDAPPLHPTVRLPPADPPLPVASSPSTERPAPASSSTTLGEAASTMSSANRTGRARRTWPAVLTAAALVVVAGAAALSLQHRSPRDVPRRSPAATAPLPPSEPFPAPAVSAPAPPPPAEAPAFRPAAPAEERPPPAEAATVAIKIVGAQEKISVAVDGSRAEVRGNVVRLPRDDRNHLLRVTTAHFVAEEFAVRGDKPRSLRLKNELRLLTAPQ